MGAREKLHEQAAQRAAAEVAAEHLALLDKASEDTADIETLKGAISILDAHQDYRASAPLKLRLGRKVARAEQLAGRRND